MRKFIISYRNELGGNREFVVSRRNSSNTETTLMDAIAEFNVACGGFDTPLGIWMEQDGVKVYRWTMDGRYSVPRLVVSPNTPGLVGQSV